MRTISFRNVLEAVCGLIGHPFDTTGSAQITAMVPFLNLKMQEAWSFGPWPEWTLTEERTPVDYLIDREQSEETKIGMVFGVYEKDPRKYKNVKEVAFTEGQDGIWLPESTLATVWVQFQKPAPLFSAATWTAGKSYQRYDVAFYPGTEDVSLFLFRGECYQADLDENGADIWVLVEFPAVLANAVAYLTAGMMQRMYGKPKDALALEEQGMIALATEAKKTGIRPTMRVRAS